MATVLKKLIVSLTKHGAHKIAFLLQKFDKDDILNHLKGDYMDIHIDSAQTKVYYQSIKPGSHQIYGMRLKIWT